MERRDFLSKASLTFAASLASVEVGARDVVDLPKISELAVVAIGELLPPGVQDFEFRLGVLNGMEFVELSAIEAHGQLFYDLDGGMWK